MSIERRRTPRAPCDLPCLWRRRQRPVEGRVKDLNAHGLFFETQQVVELGYVVDLVVTFPDGPLEVLGVARFVGNTRWGHGIGIAIHGIARDDRTRWEAYHRTAVAELIARLPTSAAKHLR